MDVFSKLGLGKLTESVLGKRGSGKAFSCGIILASVFFGYLCVGECLEDINTLVEDFRRKPYTPSYSRDELAEKTGLSLATIKREITILRKKGCIDRDGSNKNGRWLILRRL